jgi:alanine transaminase
VQSLLAWPALMDMPGASEMFAPDAIARARAYLDAETRVGAYTESQGLSIVRQEVADFITARDGVPAVKENVFLTDGASKGVEFLLKLVLRGKDDGVLVPIPQYPLYSAALALAQAHLLPYELDEDAGWSLPIAQLEASLADARKNGVACRGLVVINPGNPTGNCLPLGNMQDIVRFCKKEGLVLMADEVYQENIYQGTAPFHSFKKVVAHLGQEAEGVELVSFHSVSKGFLGECGMRGGYFELHGFQPDVQAQLLKLVSIGLCSNVMGQIAVGLMVRPPQPGEASHALYAQERDTIMESLKRRATKLVAGLNALEGVTCNEAQGAMYAFPSITIPAKAQAAAAQAGKAADTFYALALLEATGIVVVPGSGFRQKKDTWHFRTTFLPPEGDMDSVIEQMAAFHADFMAQYK